MGQRPKVETKRRDTSSRRPTEAGPDALRAAAVNLYVNEGLSTYRIADKLGVHRLRVTRMLHQAGVSLSPRGKARPRPSRQVAHPSEDTLRHLYLDECLSSTAIGRRLGLSDRLIREDLARYGIDRRHRGAWDRRDRTDVDPNDLDVFYVEKEMPADEVGDHVGVSPQIVLRSAHSYGVRVRIGGTPSPAKTDVPLLDALYGDPFVRRVLDHHRAPVVETIGPLWQRFPTPFPLTKELLSDLYESCGLSCFQIELLTGQSSIMVLRHLEANGIPRRPRGGLSPFLRRRRAEAAGR